MKTGIELIVQERKEQLKKHGRTVEYDRANNNQGQLIIAAQALLQNSVGRYMNPPSGWDANYWDKLLSKNIEERLVIAGALIAAEIDRKKNQS